jgi:Fe-S cluster assembly protein SufD
VGDGHSHPRVWIELAPGARAAVIESHAGDGVSFVNSVSEIHLQEHAALEHVRIQTRSETVFDFGWTEVWQEAGSDLRSTNAAFGGKLARNDLNVFLNGENCHCLMNGAYFAAGEQVIDNHTRLDHAKPNCNSFELYKGILAGRSTGVFNGKIFVHQDAQKTDAKQTNQALLLSKQATVNTKPQLEIFADDVKCTHGATVGQLREDAMFYLRARGIPEKQAKAILVQAFVGEVFENVQCEPVRESLQNLLLTKFERNASSIEEM